MMDNEWWLKENTVVLVSTFLILLLVCVCTHHFVDDIISVTVCQEAVAEEYLEQGNLIFQIRWGINQ